MEPLYWYILSALSAIIGLGALLNLFLERRRDRREAEDALRLLFSGPQRVEDALEIAFSNDVLPVDIPMKKD